MKKQVINAMIASLVLGTGALRAGEVIGNISGSMSADEVREAFVGDKTSVGSTKLVPIDNSTAQGDFLSKVVKVDSAKYGSIWAKKGFRDGVSPPPVRGSDADVAAAVASTPGAIGYVNSAPAGAKVIMKY